MTLTYSVVAGNIEGDDFNAKYIAPFNTLEEAFEAAYNNGVMYDTCDIEIRQGDYVYLIDMHTNIYNPLRPPQIPSARRVVRR